MSSRATNTPCPVCGSQQRSGRLQAKDRLVVSCAECRLQFVDPLTESAATEALDKLGESFIETYIQEQPSYEAYFRKKAVDLRRQLPEGRVLDVGCATGVFLSEAGRAGLKATGLDLLPAAVTYAQDRMKVDARLGLLSDAGFDQEQFDAVTLFQVIEHVAGPRGLLSEVGRVLKPGGVLMLTTPDRRGFLARLMGRRWFEYFNEEHLTYFERRSLRRLLNDGGFTVGSMSTEFGRSFTLGYVAERLSGFYYTDASGASRAARVLSRLLRLARGVSLREPWQSLYVIARRT